MTSRWQARKTDLKRLLLFASLVFMSEVAFAQADQISLSQWAIISQEVDEAPAKIDFSKPKTIDESKRLCDPARVRKLSIWPDSLTTQIKLCQGEIAHILGHLDEAHRFLTNVKKEGPRHLSARASYRLAEIAEQKVWTMPAQGKIVRDPELAHQEIIQFLTVVREARDAFLQVATFGDAFWSRRAAFRVISIMDDALWEIRTNLYVANLQGRFSPFEFLFGHFIENKTLDEQLYGLEQERGLLETSLIKELQVSKDDPVLMAALVERAQDPFSISPSFTEFIKAPWIGDLSASPFIRIQKRYYEKADNQSLKSISRTSALARLHSTLNERSGPLPLALAMVYLTDEGESISEDLIRFALYSDNIALRAAGFYVAEAFASHSLTPIIIDTWKATLRVQSHVPFGGLQNTLYGQKERVLLCLARHFSLGRSSTQLILETRDISDNEKAWLLQFRRDKKSVAVANAFLTHPNAIVRLRARHALHVWNRRGGDLV